MPNKEPNIEPRISRCDRPRSFHGTDLMKNMANVAAAAAVTHADVMSAVCLVRSFACLSERPPASLPPYLCSPGGQSASEAASRFVHTSVPLPAVRRGAATLRLFYCYFCVVVVRLHVTLSSSQFCPRLTVCLRECVPVCLLPYLPDGRTADRPG